MNYRQGITIMALAILVVSANTFAGDQTGAAHGDREHRAGHGGPGRGGSPEEMIMRVAERLDLDATQRQEVRNILQAARPSFAALRERSRANRAAFLALDVDDPDYGARLQDLSAGSGELAAELTLLAGQLRADVSAVLTDVQRQMLAERMARLADRGRRAHDPATRRW